MQRWMQSAILADLELPPQGVRQRILPSATMKSEQRLNIYREMYVARLNEALRADFPALADLIRDDLFDQLVPIYVREHPSRSYTLNDLGAALPDFLGRLVGLPHAGYCQDLARLEWVRARVFDEEETEPLSREEVARIPAEAWAGARLTPIAAFRLLELSYPAQEYVEAVMAEEEAERPALRRRATRLAVFRRNYAVTSIELSGPEFKILGALADGQPLGAAVGRARAETVFRMFQRWMAEGLFRSVTV